jgi:uncharacterized oxidoreductase
VLEDFAAALFSAAGVAPAEARAVAHSLVDANLAGHDSHGVMRIPYYLDALASGDVVAGAPFTILHDAPAAITADGGWGFGQTQARRLTELLIDRARATGTAVGTLRRCGHIGRLGEYNEQAAAAGLVSIVMVNTHGHARRVAPVGGTAPRLGTNPLGIGCPADAGPLILDFGTSATAEGKVRLKKIAKQPCPEGWLLDSHGRPTTDPETLYADPPGTILPLGGAQAYKGFGLALMIEVFAGALSGGVTMRERPINQNGNCVFIQLIDPAALGGADHFAAEVRQLAAFIRATPRIPGVDEILLPGDPERRTRAARLASGIPLDDANWAPLLARAQKLSVPAP